MENNKLKNITNWVIALHSSSISESESLLIIEDARVKLALFDPLQASLGEISLPIVLNYHLFFEDFLSQKREYLINFIQYVACNKVTLSDSFTRHPCRSRQGNGEIDNFFR